MTANVEFDPDDWPSVDLWGAASSREQDSQVVFLPENKSGLEVGVYGAEIADLVEALNDSGVHASPAHGPEAQRWRERKGHGEVSIIMSASASVRWDLMSREISRLFGSDQLQVFIKGRNKDGVVSKVRLRGRGEDVAEALDQVKKSIEHPAATTKQQVRPWGP
jgi:hypothetical protein